MDEIEGTLFLEVDHPHLASEFAMEVPCTLSRGRVTVSIVSFPGRRIILIEGVPTVCSLLPFVKPTAGIAMVNGIRLHLMVYVLCGLRSKNERIYKSPLVTRIPPPALSKLQILHLTPALPQVVLPQVMVMGGQGAQ